MFLKIVGENIVFIQWNKISAYQFFKTTLWALCSSVPGALWAEVVEYNEYCTGRQNPLKILVQLVDTALVGNTMAPNKYQRVSGGGGGACPSVKT